MWEENIRQTNFSKFAVSIHSKWQLVHISTKASSLTNLPLANSAMTALVDVNVRIGRRAKGNCSDMSTLSRSLSCVRSSILEKIAMSMVGQMAIVRVSKTRCQRFHVRFKNPWKMRSVLTSCLPLCCFLKFLLVR